ncbi:MAG: putative metal-binding motif-containing protein [Saprospiraceae bacterium]|nr:putative metal-binding motif-containing protein [Saprospiraceae bacterium]
METPLTTMACSPPSGYVTDNTDCNDNNVPINPGATEICNGLDDDCDGGVDEGVQNTYYADVDNDSYGDAIATLTACSPQADMFPTTQTAMIIML